MTDDQFADCRYTRNFLTQVIARVDFLGAVAELRQELPRRLATAASKCFPIVEPGTGFSQKLRVSPGGVLPEGDPVQQAQWTFHGKDRDKSLVMSSGSVLVSYLKYSSFEDLLESFMPVVDELSRSFPDLRSHRTGLRYINNIAPTGSDPFNWSRLVKKNLLCMLGVLEPRNVIARAFCNTEANHGDFRLRYQYGLHNPDYPAPIRQRVFVMDLDAFSETPQGLSEVGACLGTYHATIQDAFERSITEGMRKLLNA